MHPLPDALPLVRILRNRGARHYLVTHRDLAAMDVLAAWGVGDCFDGHMLRDDPGFVRKPSPEGILYLIQQEHLQPEKCLMIGDRPLDVDAGHGAGTLTCLLDTENRFPQQLCDIRVQSMAELRELLTT